jgi:hypothetical protein
MGAYPVSAPGQSPLHPRLALIREYLDNVREPLQDLERAVALVPGAQLLMDKVNGILNSAVGATQVNQGGWEIRRTQDPGSDKLGWGFVLPSGIEHWYIPQYSGGNPTNGRIGGNHHSEHYSTYSHDDIRQKVAGMAHYYVVAVVSQPDLIPAAAKERGAAPRAKPTTSTSKMKR